MSSVNDASTSMPVSPSKPDNNIKPDLSLLDVVIDRDPYTWEVRVSVMKPSDKKSLQPTMLSSFFGHSDDEEEQENC